MTTQPGTGSEPPESPVPAPRPTKGMWCRAQTCMTAWAWAVEAADEKGKVIEFDAKVAKKQEQQLVSLYADLRNVAQRYAELLIRSSTDVGLRATTAHISTSTRRTAAFCPSVPVPGGAGRSAIGAFRSLPRVRAKVS